MLYLFESEISENKILNYALLSVFGIGLNQSSLISKKLGFSNVLKVSHLSKSQINQLIKQIESMNLKLTNDLKQIHLVSKKKLVSIKCYRGIRRNNGLPVRGQRTHTNARTAKKRR